MPHDVIMPALGMAQDSGVLVAWLKGPGDPVKVGDGLMEVETDKATMEVEAEADGYLTEIRVQAGESAPVGGVVAVIADLPEGAAPKPAGRDDADEVARHGSGQEAESDDDDTQSGTKVIMPTLGMAQDTGKIIAWVKAPGDAVAADETLFEVETDKAAMEVPAGSDGYLAGCYVEAGDSAPVGAVIALITATPSRGSTKPPAEKPALKLAAKADDPTISAPKPTVPKVARSPVATVHAGRILASPKARRLARERGIDLAALASTGVAQPIHAADLDRAPTLEAALAPQATPVPVSQTQRATAELDGGAFSGFLDWMASETGDGDDQGRRAAVLAAFAAGALREATGGGGGIAVSSPGAPERRFAEPDRGPLGTAAQAEGTVALRLRDLARTAVTGVDFAAADAPVLSLSARDERLRLDYVGALPPEQVIALLDGFATRLADPLRHIL